MNGYGIRIIYFVSSWSLELVSLSIVLYAFSLDPTGLLSGTLVNLLDRPEHSWVVPTLVLATFTTAPSVFDLGSGIWKYLAFTCCIIGAALFLVPLAFTLFICPGAENGNGCTDGSILGYLAWLPGSLLLLAGSTAEIIRAWF